MSATDELRKLLDERGVEWSKPSDEYWELFGGIPISDYVTIVGNVSIDEATDGTLVVNNLTPAQAIEATLGRGELERENAKLRELLAEARTELVDMYDYMDGGYAWPSIGEDPYFGPFYKQLCSVLGVEVEE